MPKPFTFPNLYNDLLQLRLSRLKEWNYLHPGQRCSGSVAWSRNGEQTASILLTADTGENPYIELNYRYGDEPRKYRVDLVTIPSNLGRGEVWYFVCPHTGKRCRILYSVNGWFLHREAVAGGMYTSQTWSHKWRNVERVYGCYFDLDKTYAQLNRKHFKTRYRGQPTKRYKKLLHQIEQAKQHSAADIERLLVFGY